MRSRNEQIELDNFKADYFDANTTGKIAFKFRFYLAVNITATKNIYVYQYGKLTEIFFLRMRTQAGESNALPVKSDPTHNVRSSLRGCSVEKTRCRVLFSVLTLARKTYFIYLTLYRATSFTPYETFFQTCFLTP